MYGLSRRIWQKLITPTKAFEAGTTRYLTEAFHQIGALLLVKQTKKSNIYVSKKETVKTLQNCKIALTWKFCHGHGGGQGPK